MNARRLLKLADFLEKLPREKFNYATIVGGSDVPRKELDCGSTACAIGWCPVVFPRLAKYGKSSPLEVGDYCVEMRDGSDKKVRALYSGRSFKTAQRLFGISVDEADGLFDPGYQLKIDEHPLSGNATPKQVAALIRRFVRKNTKKKA